MFKVAIYDLPEAFFLGNDASKKFPERHSGRRRGFAPPSADQEQIKEWQERVEQLSNRYASVLQAYEQLKEQQQAAPKWRNRCQKLLNELLRVVSACDFTGSVDRSEDPEATLEAVLTGIQQVRDGILQSLCDLDILEVVEPEPGSPFDRIRCIAVGNITQDDPDDAVVQGLIECGLAYKGQVIKPAKVTIGPARPPVSKEE